MYSNLVFIIGFVGCVLCYCDRDPTRPLEWSGGNFLWPDQAIKSIYQTNGRFQSKNVIATRVQIYKDDAIVALPRYKDCIPATLAKVCLKERGCEAVLQPFPCWSTQEEGNCNALQSVVDLVLDCHEILWVLDTGIINALEEQPIRRCPPKIVAFSMKTNQQVRTIDLCGLVGPASRLQYLQIEYTSDGHPFIYISDASTRSILVYDVDSEKGYRVVLPKAVIGGGRRDVLYISLIQKGCGNNYLVLSYLSSPRMFSIRTDYLRSGACNGKIIDLGPKPGKMIILGTDLGSAIFFRYEGDEKVYRWDVNQPLANRANSVLVYKSPDCYLGTHIVPDLKRQRVRILESNFPDYLQNTVGCGVSQRLTIIEGCVGKYPSLSID